MLFAPDIGWRLAFGIGAVLGLGILVLRQWVPVQPRTGARINSWIAELIAVYSPPMPALVRNRNSTKLQRSQAVAEGAVATS